MATPPSDAAGYPRAGNVLTAALGRLTLFLLRWRIEGALPEIPKAVLVVAPHTSNWDFVIGLSAKLALEVRVSWLGKASLFRFPFGRLLRALGGVAVDRKAADGLVGVAVRELAEKPQLFMALSPEGTRRRVERWKTGFYRIANGAGVPLLLIRIDYRSRALRIGPLIPPTGAFEADLREIQSHISAAMAYRPENY